MTKVEMQEIINKLHLRLSRAAIECVYCHGVFAVNDPAWAEHWRDCPSHPARAALRQAQYELADLRSQLKVVALELDRCRNSKMEAR